MRNIVLITLFVAANGLFFNRETDVDPKSTSQWPSLRTTFDPAPLSKGFDKMPLTAKYAESQGWTQTGEGCLNNGQFAGNRYIYKGDTSMSLLFDVNGIISGIQMNAKIDELEKKPNPFRFEDVSMFQRNVIENDDVETVTAYFVDPAKICTGGRTAEQLKEEGVGNQLYLQNGPTPADLVTAPLRREAALSSNWTDNKCFPMMGTHTFYDVEHMDEYQCQGARPAFLLFNKQGQLHGFGFQLFGTIKSSRYENPPMLAVEMILGKKIVPQCIRDMQELVGQTTMHVYFVDHPMLINCL